MSLAEDLLNSLPEDQPTATSADPVTEPHIVINPDRTVTVPESLQHIAVEGDHNVETVTFDGPRYWDGHDLSLMKLRIVFQRPDGHREPHLAENVRVDSDDANVIHFDWTISSNVTAIRGNISFTVCAKIANAEGVREREWHTRLNQDLIVDEGMDCSGEEIIEQNPDIIEAILVQLDELKNAGGNSPGSNPGQNLTVDTTLTQSGAAADAQVVGAALAGKQPKGNYLTEDDIDTIVDTVKNEVPLVTVAKAPVFVDNKSKMTDTGEVYVLLPDGYLWAYMAVDSVVLGAELFEIGGIIGDNGMDGMGPNRIRTAKIPCNSEYPISIACNSNAKWIVHFFRDEAWIGKAGFVSTNNGDIVQLHSQPDDVTHVRLLLAYVSDANVTDIADLLSNVTITQKVNGMAWCNTGMTYNQPVDYEDRILAMETELEALVNGTF